MNPDQLFDEYRPKQALYREYCESISEIVRKVLLAAGIKTYSISFREKDSDKLREKIIRKKAEGTEYHALDDIEDLAGVRVVTYLDTQRDQVTRLIHAEFEDSCVRFENKYDPEGYRGTHLVIRLNKAREDLTEYSRYKGLKCEIQISSILYHAWSEIEHDVIYKPGEDREKLMGLGLDDIEGSFQKIMAEHLEDATIQFDLLYKKFQEVRAAGKVIYSDYLADIREAESNDKVYSILDIAEKFAHKKPEEALQMAQQAIKRSAIDAQVIGKFGTREIHGKTHKDVLKKSLEIFSRTRYWDVERVLSALCELATRPEEDVAKKASEIIKHVAKYDHGFLKQQKNLYPQKAALEFIRKLSVTDRQRYMTSIGVMMSEILSCEVEGNEWTKEDTLTHYTGALVPSEGLKKLRQEVMDLLLEIHKHSPLLKDRLILITALLTILEAPHNVVYGDDTIDMIREDCDRLVKVLPDVIFANDKVVDYPVAQQVEESLIRMQRSERFKSGDLQALYDRLQRDYGYTTYSTLVGDIHEYRHIDEDWHEAEKRRTEEIDMLVAEVGQKPNRWYERLEKYAEPYTEGVIDEWKYQSFRVFIGKLTDAHPQVATEFFVRAINEKSRLARTTFVTPYLSALRRKNNFVAWDKYVALIRDQQVSELITSALISLIVDADANLGTAIRKSDIAFLEQLVKEQAPYEFTKAAGVSMRYALMNALTRIFNTDKTRMEGLILEELKRHPEWVHVYFRELPFASHRKWMSFKDWSPEGIEAIKAHLVELPDLDWHTQETMMELGDNPIEPILDIFKRRLLHEKEDDDGRYDEVPYHFNPDLRKYIVEHERYIDEMVKWLQEMTPESSNYNWHVTDFIRQIGGASYSSILMRLIERGDHDSLSKAAGALNSFDGADFGLCFEIVKRTDDKDILGQVGVAMGGTGLVDGENGLERAYESKAKALEPYVASDDQRISAFAKDMKQSFEDQARNARERSTIRKKQRRLEFEG